MLTLLYVTCSEFKRWLIKQGVTFEQGGNGSHLKAYLGNRQSIVANHPSKELGTGLVNKIKRQLGLK